MKLESLGLGSHSRLASTIAAICALLSGCSMLETGGGKLADLPSAPAAAETPAPQPVPSITMEVRPAGKKPEISQVPLTGASTVQQVLEQTRLVKRFRRMDIHVLRPAGDQRAKLDVRYKHSDGQVDPLYDYALHAGDHLVVMENTTTVLDDMLNSVAGPARRAIGR